jgi:hypothetical protein
MVSRNPIHDLCIKGAAEGRQIDAGRLDRVIAPQQLAPVLLVQIRTEDDARQCNEARKIRLGLKTVSNVDVKKSQQSTPPLMQPSAQNGLAKSRKRVRGRALHASGSAFDVAEGDQLLKPLLDRRRGA